MTPTEREEGRQRSVTHVCHAAGCAVTVPPKMFMCRPHWYALPKHLRDAVWNEYRPGQEIDKRPTARYLLVTTWCVCFVADKEGVPHEPHVRNAEAIAEGR